MIVIDLYAGIGYFTLPYLIHGKAKFVYACEWNPDSVKALKRNLEDNVSFSFFHFSFFFFFFNYSIINIRK